MSDDKAIIVEGKAWALMGYLWILCLIPLIKKRDNPFAFFHARQGLVLFVGTVIFSGIGILPFLHFIGSLGLLLIFALNIFGLINVLMGKYWEIPIAGNIAKKIEL